MFAQSKALMILACSGWSSSLIEKPETLDFALLKARRMFNIPETSNVWLCYDDPYHSQKVIFDSASWQEFIQWEHPDGRILLAEAIVQEKKEQQKKKRGKEKKILVQEYKWW